jgi:hypothetical protein
MWNSGFMASRCAVGWRRLLHERISSMSTQLLPQMRLCGERVFGLP